MGKAGEGEARGIEQQAAAPVNTTRLKFPLVNAVTRSQGEAPSNLVPPIKEDPLDWNTLVAMTRDTAQRIQEHQSNERLLVPAKLMEMTLNETKEDDITKEEKEWLAEREGLGTESSPKAEISQDQKNQQLIKKQSRVELTVEELFQLAPHCKEVVLREMRSHPPGSGKGEITRNTYTRYGESQLERSGSCGADQY